MGARVAALVFHRALLVNAAILVGFPDREAVSVGSLAETMGNEFVAY
jgi:hypothetical protein